jgi:hypothetical protein
MPREQTSPAMETGLGLIAPPGKSRAALARLDVASHKLAIALTHLEIELEEMQRRLGQQDATHRESDALRHDRARLANDLDHARARERLLAALADEAATVVSGAIQDVKAAMRGLNA